ncbi:hypothetical protein ACJX0J_018463, partial [Zea mays]
QSQQAIQEEKNASETSVQNLENEAIQEDKDASETSVQNLEDEEGHISTGITDKNSIQEEKDAKTCHVWQDLKIERPLQFFLCIIYRARILSGGSHIFSGLCILFATKGTAVVIDLFVLPYLFYRIGEYTA